MLHAIRKGESGGKCSLSSGPEWPTKQTSLSLILILPGSALLEDDKLSLTLPSPSVMLAGLLGIVVLQYLMV